jgi:hypothetical protein
VNTGRRVSWTVHHTSVPSGAQATTKNIVPSLTVPVETAPLGCNVSIYVPRVIFRHCVASASRAKSMAAAMTKARNIIRIRQKTFPTS